MMCALRSAWVAVLMAASMMGMGAAHAQENAVATDSGQERQNSGLAQISAITEMPDNIFSRLATLEQENALLALELQRAKLQTEIATVRQKLEDVKSQAKPMALPNVVPEPKPQAAADPMESTEALAEMFRSRSGFGAATPSVFDDMLEREQEEQQTAATPPSVGSMIMVTEVRGTGNDLQATLQTNQGLTYYVRAGSSLPTGHMVQQVSRDGVTVAVNERVEMLGFMPGTALLTSGGGGGASLGMFGGAPPAPMDDGNMATPM